jgi:hypothetical protein
MAHAGYATSWLHYVAADGWNRNRRGHKGMTVAAEFRRGCSVEQNNTDRKPGNTDIEQDSEATPELEGISPLNPSTFPRAEDDAETLANSPEFHDLPDPGPYVGRKNVQPR